MLFRRRTPMNLMERLRIAFWPRNSWGRSLRYFTKRVLRLSGSPHAIALGFAIGAFASFTPFVGFHIMISVFVALMVGGNILAAAFGTIVGNPFTFPFIWWATYELGGRVLNDYRGPIRPHAMAHGLLHQSFSHILPIIKPMLVGSLPLGLLVATVSYVIVRVGVKAYQAARRQRLEHRRLTRGTQVAADDKELT